MSEITAPSYRNRLREWIARRGYKVKRLADDTGIPLRTLWEYIGERTVIDPIRLSALAAALECPADQLLSPPIISSTGEMMARTPERRVFEGGGTMALPEHQHQFSPGEALMVSPLFELSLTDQLDSIERVIHLGWEAWFASRPAAVLRSVSRLLPDLEKLAYVPSPSVHVLRAKELAAHAHGLLGSVSVDALQHDTAFYHYRQAYQFGEDIRDTDLMATYHCLVGEVIRRQHDPGEAVRYIEHAKEVASHAAPATRGHVLQLLAYTYGEMGQETAFERTIAEATDLLAHTGEGRDVARREFVPFEIYEIRGKVHRDLGKPMQALSYLDLAERSLQQAEVATPRWYALLDISRAQAFCDAGDLTTGLALAGKGFLQAYQCRSPHQLRRVRKLVRKMEGSPFRTHIAVQEIKELLYQTYMRVDTLEEFLALGVQSED